ncbi:RCC1 domain-containing protein 1 [Bicyclus anynana]|uniref:RCC1 domain-containing protein 1 n=1 Tax=Bicyclus anynana TaxID=110368 RepID=A0A6J1MGN6_BICAN|nr:RCC1 domain-containing protein 1 [Bicyclus anynana]
MYYVTGTNLYGQWIKDANNKSLFESFQPLEKENEKDIDLTRAKLVTSCWSYNIFQIDDTFILVGAWKGVDNQVIKVPNQSKTSKQSNFLIAGNDYMLILAEKVTRTIWFYDFKTEQFKRVNITEQPILENEVKKLRTSDDIIKVVATNNVYIYLTSEGNVYTGSVPSYLDTRHCFGKVIDVECGYEHYLLLTDKGRVYTWGNGRRLQLGHGDLINLETPTEVEALAGIKITKIRAGGWHSLALSEYGDLYVWGWNDTGQLGMNKNGLDNVETKKNYATPTLVDICDVNGEVDILIKDIACGTRHSAILLQDGTVWTTGWNKYGQLGFSPQQYEKLDCFTKSFYSPNISSLIGGSWNTVVEVCM